MKRCVVWRRYVSMRLIGCPIRSVCEYVVYYGKKIILRNNHCVDIDEENLKVPFVKILETRSRKILDKFMSFLGSDLSDKWLKETLWSVYIGGLKR